MRTTAVICKRELEHIIPRSHSPENSGRFPETFGDVCKNKASFLQVFVENRFLPFASVAFRRTSEPVPLETEMCTPHHSGKKLVELVCIIHAYHIIVPSSSCAKPGRTRSRSPGAATSRAWPIQYSTVPVSAERRLRTSRSRDDTCAEGCHRALELICLCQPTQFVD